MLNEIILNIKELSRPDKISTLQNFFKTRKGEYAEGDKLIVTIKSL